MRQRVMNELAGCHPYDSCLALQLLWGVLLIIDDELIGDNLEITRYRWGSSVRDTSPDSA
eukprot:scaffold67879_cov33-Phaeocystis_antarctica.AAC.1